MSIERAIYGSISRGIESDTAGFQYYSYTKGYKDLISDERSVEGRLNSSYVCPATYETSNWYNGTARNATDRNAASEKVAKEHPLSFSYFTCEINNSTKACFVYAKDMGHDWSNARFATPYHNIVICDMEQIKRAPVLYCNSPSVCCDIKRSEFFPENGELTKPQILSDIASLDDDDKGLILLHASPFGEITVQRILDFLKGSLERKDILKKMFRTVLDTKSRILDKKLVIADKTENVMMWIAAISYLLPYRNASKVSFSTYTYNPGDYDINGVFVPELNGISVSDSDRNYVSRYVYDQAREAFTLFDMYAGYEAEIPAGESLFMSMLDYITRKHEMLDKYKAFIISETTYTEVNGDYIAGYDLFALFSGYELDESQFTSAVGFAMKYGTSSLNKRLLSLIFSDKNILSGNADIGVIGSFLQFCSKSGIESVISIENRLYDRWMRIYYNPSPDGSDAFRDAGDIIEKLLSLKDGELEVQFIKRSGFERMNRFMSDNPAIWKARYMNSALIRYFVHGNIDILSDNKIMSLLGLIFSVLFVSDDAGYVSKVVEASKRMTSLQQSFAYLNKAYVCLLAKRFDSSAAMIRNNIIMMFVNASKDEAEELMQVIIRSGMVEHYFPDFVSAISAMDRMERVLGRARDFVASCDNGIDRKYVYDLIACVIDRLKRIEREGDVSSGFFKDASEFFDECEVRFNCIPDKSDCGYIFDRYVYYLSVERPDLFISNDDAAGLELLLRAYGKDGENGYEVVAKLMLDLYELGFSVKDKGKNNIFLTGRDSVDFSIDEIPDKWRDTYIDGVGKRCAQFWINTGQEPECRDMLGNYRKRDIDASYVMLAVLSYIVAKDGMKRGRKIARLIESSIDLERNMENKAFRNGMLSIITMSVKKSEIIPVLEKDLETKKRMVTRKNSFIASPDPVPKVEIFELQGMIDEINEEYQTLKKKNPLTGLFKGMFGR